jgi:hypothetical protein
LFSLARIRASAGTGGDRHQAKDSIPNCTVGDHQSALLAIPNWPVGKPQPALLGDANSGYAASRIKLLVITLRVFRYLLLTPENWVRISIRLA